MLYSSDPDTLLGAARTVFNFSLGPDEYVSEIIKADFVGLLVVLLADKTDSVQMSCLRALRNIAFKHRQVVIESGALLQFHNLLRSPLTSIQEECCLVIAIITDGTPAQIEAVIEANLFPDVISLLRSDDQEARKEAAWAICNATSHPDPQHVKYLVAQGCLKPLCDMLSSQDPETLEITLDSIDSILSVGQEEVRNGSSLKNEYLIMLEDLNAINSIVSLQNHAIEDVFSKSKDIVEKYLL